MRSKKPEPLFSPKRRATTEEILYDGYRIFPRGNATRVWYYHPLPSRAEVANGLEL